MTTQRSVHEELKQLLIDTLDLPISPSQIGDDEPLFEAGLGVDSVEALSLVNAIEKRFGVSIPDDEIGMGMFQDIRSLAEVLCRLSPTLSPTLERPRS